jgi:hypothetical protein
MKHGLIVLAHDNIQELMDVLGQFGPGFTAYVHLDRKARASEAELKALREMPMVRMVSRKYAVNWGGLNIVKAILHLTREALKDEGPSYFHTITGTDRIIVKPSEFKAFFERNKGKEYLLHFPLPTPYWHHGGMDRLAYYDPLDLFDIRTKWGKRLRNMVLHFQQRTGISRDPGKDLPPLYGGSMSWSLSREVLEHVVDHLEKHPDYLNRFAHTFCPDEIALQTVIMNSPYASRVENNNLRFIDWDRKKAAQPYVLDLANWEAMCSSGMLLARKILSPYSDSLIERLRKHIQE